MHIRNISLFTTLFNEVSFVQVKDMQSFTSHHCNIASFIKLTLSFTLLILLKHLRRRLLQESVVLIEKSVSLQQIYLLVVSVSESGQSQTAKVHLAFIPLYQVNYTEVNRRRWLDYPTYYEER